MVSFSNGKIAFDYDFCQQCGACLAVCPVGALSARLRGNGLSDIVVDHETCIKCQRCVRCCPAHREGDPATYFADIRDKRYFLGYNSSDEIRREASSGGVCRTLIVEALRSGLVDGVYTLGRDDEYPHAKGCFYTAGNIPAYKDIPNSVYHSVMQCRELGAITKCDRLMIVGTSCQLHALERAVKGKYNTLIKVCIFCKQQKTLDSTRFLAKMMGRKIPRDLKFSTRYRGDGWPGIVRVMGAELPWNRAAQLPFGRRLWTVPGCNICGDPFGFESGADISLMDPWTIRTPNRLGETLVTVSSAAGMELLGKVGQLTLEPRTYEEVAPALDEPDIRRKQALVPYFKGADCTRRVALAGAMERLQRWYLRGIATLLPRMPIIFYRCLCKLPDWRKIILGNKI
ncbi:MAG: Coenzyme F420 hydrogenase/dehydrogenase, beta subunit C-terminal domain [Pseudoflavonifractor sp.]|nr:Coenzyme F420 hydrogenase/dehydrogenase, beta subunit C-terminal domain [Pseudoflavonifractor sp.]